MRNAAHQHHANTCNAQLLGTPNHPLTTYPSPLPPGSRPAGKSAEELGQGEAIAVNLREMFGFRVPIISVVIGEGGSGGALAIGCANK